MGWRTQRTGRRGTRGERVMPDTHSGAVPGALATDAIPQPTYPASPPNRYPSTPPRGTRPASPSLHCSAGNTHAAVCMQGQARTPPYQ